MTTVKFTQSDLLKEIQSRLYLITKREFTQQEILELSISIVSENLDLLVSKILSGHRTFEEREIEDIKRRAVDWGKGTEDSSTIIDQILYG